MFLIRIGIPVNDLGELIFPIGIGILDKDWFWNGSFIPDMNSNGLVIPIMISIPDKDSNELDFLIIIAIWDKNWYLG